MLSSRTSVDNNSTCCLNCSTLSKEPNESWPPARCERGGVVPLSGFARLREPTLLVPAVAADAIRIIIILISCGDRAQRNDGEETRQQYRRLDRDEREPLIRFVPCDVITKSLFASLEKDLRPGRPNSASRTPAPMAGLVSEQSELLR